MSEPDTKQKILDSAEQYFAEVGYYATSLRNITATAGVNLAAVNYHFGSKEALMEAVILRRLRPLNELRSSRLETVLQSAEQAGKEPLCRDVLRSFIEPTLHLRQQGSATENFIALIGRALADPQGQAMKIFAREMQPLMQRLFHALSRSLPRLTQQQLFWKVHFAIGSLSHVMRCSEKHAMVPADVNIDLPIDELVENFPARVTVIPDKVSTLEIVDSAWIESQGDALTLSDIDSASITSAPNRRTRSLVQPSSSMCIASPYLRLTARAFSSEPRMPCTAPGRSGR